MEYDVVNKPRHYNQGGIECIDALKAATVSKTGIEAVCTIVLCVKIAFLTTGTLGTTAQTAAQRWTEVTAIAI